MSLSIHLSAQTRFAGDVPPSWALAKTPDPLILPDVQTAKELPTSPPPAEQPDMTTIKRLIDRKALNAMVPLSERTIDAMEKKGKFPKRFALSARRVVWDADDVAAWMAAHKGAGVQVAQPGATPG